MALLPTFAYTRFDPFSLPCPHVVFVPSKRIFLSWLLWQRLGMVEERIGKLLTDDPTVIEASLAQYSDLVYPDNTSVLHK